MRDIEWIRDLLKRDAEAAISVLSDLYYDQLCRLAFVYTRDYGSAEDAVQETLISLWMNTSTVSDRHTRSLEYYLVRSVKYRAINIYRERMKAQGRNAEYTDRTGYPVMCSAERSMIQQERYDRLRAFIEEFPYRERQCLLMVVDEGLSTRQIADALKVSVGAVQRSLTSARKRFRQRLSEL